MFKWLVTLAFTLLVNNALAIQVEGTGSSFIEARNDAFAKAIDYYVGTVVVSERDLHNYKLIKNEILVYSSGYVDDYKVISQTTFNNQIRLVLDVSVSSNRISNRILGKFDSNSLIDGNKIQGVVDSYNQERTSATKLMRTILNDYPQRAFNIVQLPYYVATLNYRDSQLVMPYKLSWNYNYLKALGEATEKIQDAKSTLLKKANGSFIISVKPPDSLVFGNMMKYEFNDLNYSQEISSAFYDRELRVMGRVINKNNETVWYICHHPKFLSQGKSFYAMGDLRNLVIYGNSEEQGEVRLDISPKLYTLLKDVYKIELQIVGRNNC